MIRFVPARMAGRVVRRIFALASALGAGLGAVTAMACPYDNESYAREADALPCVFEAVLGTYPEHSRDFYRVRIRAADAVLDWVPMHLDALDAKGMALLKLGRTKDAVAVMRERAQLAPDSFASQVNLAAAHSSAGHWEEAIEALDRAIALDPTASVGRVHYQRQLAVFMREVETDPNRALPEPRCAAR